MMRIFSHYGSKFCNPKLGVLSRFFHQSTDILSGKEVKIPVARGHVAGKEWGKRGGRPLLGVHGLLDNCATFDKLAPLLPPSVHFVSIDLPGSGLSPPYPTGIPLDLMTFSADIKRILRYLDWQTTDAIGHCMGAGILLYYAAIRPNDINRLVGLDPAKPMARHVKESCEMFEGRLHMVLAADEEKPPCQLSEAEVLQWFIKSSKGSLTEEAARVLVDRGFQYVDEDRTTMTLNYDGRVKQILYPDLSIEQSEAFTHSFGKNCDSLMITTTRGSVPEWAMKMDGFPLWEFEKVCRSYKRFQHVQVEGTHHVHLNDPDRVAPHIVQFLENGQLADVTEVEYLTGNCVTW